MPNGPTGSRKVKGRKPSLLANTSSYYVETEPEPIWPIVIKHGSSLDDDLRSAVASCRPEHIWEHHFEIFFPKLEEEIQGGNFNLRDTLQICWKFDLEEEPVTR